MSLRKSFLLSLVLVTAPSALAQLDVIDPAGKKIGTATHTHSVGNGRITSKLVMNLSQSGASMTVSSLSVHSTTGDPVSYILGMKASGQGRTFNMDTKVNFSGKKATLVATAMGTSETKIVTAPGTVRDVTRVWATGKVPAVGTKTTYYQLDPTEATFLKHTDTYHGLRTLTIGGKKVRAHVIVAVGPKGTSKEYFTSKGELLKLESKDFTLVKR